MGTQMNPDWSNGYAAGFQDGYNKARYDQRGIAIELAKVKDKLRRLKQALSSALRTYK